MTLRQEEILNDEQNVFFAERHPHFAVWPWTGVTKSKTLLQLMNTHCNCWINDWCIWILSQVTADPLKCSSCCSTCSPFLCRQTRSRATTCRSNTSKPDDGKKKALSEANYKLRKAKSLVNHPPFIITAITPLWLRPPRLYQREAINVEDSLETVQPAGIMHYGAAFTQMHVNDELLREGGDRRKRGEARIMLMIVRGWDRGHCGIKYSGLGEFTCNCFT